MNTRVLASTHTDKDGYYSLNYNGKSLDPPILDVRVSADRYAGDFEHIKNTSDIQIVNFQLNPWDQKKGPNLISRYFSRIIYIRDRFWGMRRDDFSSIIYKLRLKIIINQQCSRHGG